jgi:tetratricopeptide (TPR) repeat protein
MVRTRAILFTVMMLPGVLFAQAGADQYKAGRALMDSSKFDAAVKAFEKAVAADDKSSEYRLWLGNAIGSVAQNASVLRQPFLARRIKSEFEKAVELNPANIGARDGLIMFYTQAPGVMGGSIPKAREQAEAIAKINPMRGHFSRAVIAGHEKDGVLAERELRAAAEESPDSLVAASSLANYYASNNRPEDPFAVIDKYLARHPGDLLATFWIGRLAATTGKQLDRGEKALRAILESPSLGTGPNQPVPYAIHYRLGDIAAKRGDKVAARKEYEKTIELNPKFEGAKKALKAL